MKRPPKPEIPLDGLSPELANLRALAGDAMMQEAMGIARERLGLTAEKLALLIVRAVAPDEIIEQGEEATLRGVKPETLRNSKMRREFPREINGTHPHASA